MIIEIIDETEVVPESHQELVHKVVSFAADFLKIPQTKECSISFVSSERIREINRDFRNIDKVTDVISLHWMMTMMIWQACSQLWRKMIVS